MKLAENRRRTWPKNKKAALPNDDKAAFILIRIRTFTAFF